MGCNVLFTSPNTSDSLPVTLEQQVTAQQAIQEMVNYQFLEPTDAQRPYTLVLSRTGQQLLPQQTLGHAGVRDGDTLEVVQVTGGARGEVPCPV